MPRAPGAGPRAARAPTRRSGVLLQSKGSGSGEHRTGSGAGGGRCGAGSVKGGRRCGNLFGEQSPNSDLTLPIFRRWCIPHLSEANLEMASGGLLGGQAANDGIILLWIHTLTSLPTFLFSGCLARGTLHLPDLKVRLSSHPASHYVDFLCKWPLTRNEMQDYEKN